MKTIYNERKPMKTIIEIHEEGQLKPNVPALYEAGVGRFLASKIDYVDFLISPQTERMRLETNLNIIAHTAVDNRNNMKYNRLKVSGKLDRSTFTRAKVGEITPHRIHTISELTGN